MCDTFAGAWCDLSLHMLEKAENKFRGNCYKLTQCVIAWADETWAVLDDNCSSH
jgi:hypothetical protein